MQRTVLAGLMALFMLAAAPANAREFMPLKRSTTSGGVAVSNFMPLKEVRRTAFRPPLRAREEKKQQVEEELQQLAALGTPDLKTVLDKRQKSARKSSRNPVPETLAERRKTLRGDGHIWPIPTSADQRLSSGYGSRIHPVTKKRSFHTGIDIAAAKGTPVLASEAGTVAYARPEGNLGNTVRIDHPDGSYSLYGHLSKMRVTPGQKIGQGETVGNVGATGRATGPHLHYTLKRGGKAVNPLAHMQQPGSERLHLADGA